MTGRAAHSIDEIRDELNRRIGEVVERYAPPVEGSYTRHGLYWTLNPGRADRRVGSFCVTVSGARLGKWRDFATGQHGDLLDLIALALGCDLRTALGEARAFLGLETEHPEQRRRRERRRQEQHRERQEAERRERDEAERRRRRAFALWLSGRERLRDTPVARYLTARGLDLAELGRQPRALRYAPELPYQHTDPETGEVIEQRCPAMLALAVNLAGQPVACHRTWLAIGADGRWGKAPVPKPKKVLGTYRGAAIRVWRGAAADCGAPPPLARCAPGSHVYLTEGIEDALAAALVLPEARILAAISLTNMGHVALPEAVSRVTLIADRDESPDARRALDRAIAAQARAGREVRVWQAAAPGAKDLNEALLVAAGGGEGVECA